MDTIALRFSDNYAPEEGTIKLHQDIIENMGSVWYGKFGKKISQNIKMNLLSMEEPKILLISSGTNKRYWAYIEDIREFVNEKDLIPVYYRNDADKINCWFKIIKFEKAESKILSNCFIKSSHRPLSESSKGCMNPYFIIEYIPQNK